MALRLDKPPTTRIKWTRKEGGRVATIEAVTPPVRTRSRESAYSEDDVRNALAILDSGKAAKCATLKVSDFKARTTKGGNKLSPEDQALNSARSTAATLARAIKATSQREFAVSSWVDGNDKGTVIGALLSRAPRKRAVKPEANGQPDQK